MARTPQSSFNPSSPHSSSAEAESFKGTPDTRLTVSSPLVDPTLWTRHAKAHGFVPSGTASVRFCIGVAENPQLLSDKDPFITTTQGTSATPQLSPTASSFHPCPVPSNSATDCPGVSLSMRDIDTVKCGGHPQTCYLVLSSPNGRLLAIDAVAFLLKLEQLGILTPAPRLVVDKGGQIYIRFGDPQSATVVHNHVYRAAVKCEAKYVSESEWYKDTSSGGTLPKCQVVILALAALPAFADPQHTEFTAQDILRSYGCMSAYRRLMDDGGPRLHTAVAEFSTPGAGTAAVAALNGRTVQNDGLMSSSEARNVYPGAATLCVPRHDLPLERYPIEISNSMPSILPMESDHGIFLPQSQPPWDMWSIFGPFRYRPSDSYSGGYPDFELSSHPHSCNSLASSIPHTPTMPQTKGYGQPRHILGHARTDTGRQSVIRFGRASFRSVASHHNHVDVNRICEGTDVRTTVKPAPNSETTPLIMLRNIPNKVDQAMLKRIVDESSWGKYDFMYLRIDFANDCNVGYAFINFVDPLDIIDFVKTRGNQRWNCFKSDKVAEISYASGSHEHPLYRCHGSRLTEDRIQAIQGKDCLVQKFRNSSVMLEPAHYRPKLFYTLNGPMPRLAGREEPFPSPDNQSKMKRSCDNAEHVGLFTPNASQYFRDEQRRRRSQYDRGTRLAALEEREMELTNQSYTHFA
ncbi:hypothetical protein ACRALDRAFT_2054962 [Sodiomyces alcalophilus JCM 7366]|uniref:uncharacterized protein n=1 Tax=Sodiomyces alcalophilus JCM 7366 TaxID=591952 RepID=UPI0039B6E750